jgi:integrase
LERPNCRVRRRHKGTHEDDKSKLRWLDSFLAGRDLESINRALIDTITEAKRAEGCANGTINRTLALLRAILRRCSRECEWTDRSPAIRLLKEPSRRIRFLTQDQAMALLRELPPHLRTMAAFTLSTRLRRANVTGLLWEQVDLERRLAWVHPDQAKGHKAIGVPLNDTAMALVRAQVGKHPERVFTYDGEPVFQVSSMAWYKALKRAGIENFRWRDLRHTWASWHVQQGTPLFALQEMAGWETEKMVRRYMWHSSLQSESIAACVSAKLSGRRPSPFPKRRSEHRACGQFGARPSQRGAERVQPSLQSWGRPCRIV